MGLAPQEMENGAWIHSNGADARIAEQIVRYMLDHFDDTVSLQCVAGHFGYEVCYFSKLFKRLLGVSYMQYRNRIRSEIAIIFLRSTDKTVTEVAGCCGFSTVRNFNRVFRSVTGATPSQVRSMSEEVLADTVGIPEKQQMVRTIIQQQFAVTKRSGEVPEYGPSRRK